MQRGVQGEPECFVYLNNAAAFAPDVIEEFVVGEESPFSVALATTHLDRLEESLGAGAPQRLWYMLIASRSSYADAKTFYNHFGDLRMKEREFVGYGMEPLGGEALGRTAHVGDTFTHFPHQQFAQFGKAHSIIARSLDRYGTPRAKVERRIAAWMRGLSAKPQSPPPARRQAVSAMAAPHVAALRPLPWRSRAIDRAGCHAGAVHQHLVVAGVPASGNPLSVLRRGVAPMQPTKASPLGAGFVAAALPRDYNSRGEHRPIGERNPTPGRCDSRGKPWL